MCLAVHRRNDPQIEQLSTKGYGGGIHSSDSLVTFDGPGVAVKSNKAKLPSPSELSWYQGWGGI